MYHEQGSNQISLAERGALIKSHPFFYLLNDEDTKQFALQMQEVYIPPGNYIVRENDIVDKIYFIAEGKAKVTRVVATVEKTVTQHVAFVEKGHAIGLAQTGFFSTNGLRSATTTALSPVILLVIELPTLYSLANYPALKKMGEQFLLMNFIRKTALFDALSNDSIRALVKDIKKLPVRAGTKVFAKNDPANKCYLILSGKVVIKDIDQDNSEHTQLILGPGSFFGKAVLVQEEVYDVSAYTETDCELFVLERTTSFRVLADYEKETASFWEKLVKQIKNLFTKRK